jgi:hypothetical protein
LNSVHFLNLLSFHKAVRDSWYFDYLTKHS